jgi:hypothetical protein
MVNTIPDQAIGKHWKSGYNSFTMVIPRYFVKKYHLDKSGYVRLEGTTEGVLIKKMDIG